VTGLEPLDPGADASADAVARLLERAQELGLDELALDLLVYDATNEVAADRVNGGDWDDPTWDDAYERLHDEADKEASGINNNGLAAQLAYLLDGYGETELAAMLGRAAAVADEHA
jgi:hypothetical protein